MNFIDVDEYSAKIEDEGYAFYYGRLAKEKGIFNLLNAINKVKNKKLLIAGEGPDKEKIEKYIIENNLKQNVKLLGYLKTNQIKEYVRKARVIIVPSICRENCPYSILETLAIGRPIIGSNLGGIPELVVNNECGYIYNDEKTLIEKLEKLLNDEALAKKMGENAKKIANEKFSKDAYYSKIITLYEQLRRTKNKKESKIKSFYGK